MKELTGWDWIANRIAKEPNGMLLSELWAEASKTKIGVEIGEERFTAWMRRQVNDSALKVVDDRLMIASNWWDK